MIKKVLGSKLPRHLFSVLPVIYRIHSSVPRPFWLRRLLDQFWGGFPHVTRRNIVDASDPNSNTMTLADLRLYPGSRGRLVVGRQTRFVRQRARAPVVFFGDLLHG